jgi:cytochrome c553
MKPRACLLLLSRIAACLGVVAASINAARAQAPVPDTLEQRVLACAACHGKRGEGLRAAEYFPMIAGKPAGYLFNQLVNFRERRRVSSPVMNYIVAYLSDDYLREIAEYYSSLPPVYAAVTAVAPNPVVARGEELMMRGDPARKIAACASCHGKELTGMEPAIPGLVGLDPQYVAQQMGAWRGKLRRAQEPDCMANIAALLVPGDIPAIAAYLATRSPPPGAKPLPPGALELPVQCGGVDAKVAR